MPGANPKIVLSAIGAVVGVFGIAMVTMPVAFLGQYNVDFSTWKFAEKMLMTTLVMTWGFNNFLLMFGCLSCSRVGSAKTQGLMSFCLGCAFVFGIIMSLAGWSESLEFMGGKPGGLYFNIVLMGVLAIACFAGGSPSWEMSQVGKQIYWVSTFLLLMNLGYFLTMLFATESLVGAYGFNIQGEARKMTLFFLKYGMTTSNFQLILVFKTVLYSNDLAHAYFFNRGVSVYCAFTFVALAVGGVWWHTSGFEASGKAMTANSFLFLILHIVSHQGNAAFDEAIVPSLRKAIAGEAVQAREPLLVS